MPVLPSQSPELRRPTRPARLHVTTWSYFAVASTSKRPARGSTREKVQAHRARLRARGLRPIQIWVPDTRSPRFAAEIARQCELIASSPQDAEDQAFIDSIASIGL